MRKTPRIRLSRRVFLAGSGAVAMAAATGCADSNASDPIPVGEDAEEDVDGIVVEENPTGTKDAGEGTEPDSIREPLVPEESDAGDFDTRISESDTLQDSDESEATSDSVIDAWDELDTSERREADTRNDAARPDSEVAEVDGAVEEDIQVPEPEPPPSFYPAATVLDEDAFPLGVSAGSATDSSIHLSAVLAGEGPWKLVVFGDGEGIQSGEIIVEGPVEPVESDVAHVDVTYLPSSTWFRYCFVVDGIAGNTSIPRSAIGRFRTAPAEDELEVIAFGGVSCNNINYAPWDPLFHAATSALDFFLFAGDTVYADGSNTLADFRGVWREYLNDSSYRAILEATSVYATWDDHEVTNNWDPETLNPATIQAATDAFFEHLPIRRLPDSPDRIWRSHRWGKTLELFILDCRSERLPSTQGKYGTYISKEQMNWLKQGLSDSPCVFKVILNSVPITNMPFLFDLGADDSWVGYEAQREEILSHISDEITGAIWLAGDFHFGAVTRVEGENSPHYEQREVLMGPGGQFSNPGWFLLESGPQAAQYPYATPSFNFARFIADPLSSPPTLVVEFVGSDGDVLHEEILPFPEASLAP